MIVTAAGFLLLAALGIRELLTKIQKDARLPLLSTLLFTAIAYLPAQLLGDASHYRDISTAWDRALPLLPVFSLPYLLAYAQWSVFWLLLGKQEAHYRNDILAGEAIGKLICGLCFILLPTTLQRPEVTGTDYFAFLTRLIYKADKPLNLLPSLHCLESWLCIRTAFTMKKLPKGYKPVTVAFSLLVFASTLLIKQHVLVDIPAGILAGELGLLIAAKTKAGRLYELPTTKRIA